MPNDVLGAKLEHFKKEPREIAGEHREIFPFFFLCAATKKSPLGGLKSRYSFPIFKNQDKTGHFSGVQTQLLVPRRFVLHPSVRRGHHREGVMRVRMVISAA